MNCPLCGRSAILMWLLDRVQHSCDPSRDEFALAGPGSQS